MRPTQKIQNESDPFGCSLAPLTILPELENSFLGHRLKSIPYYGFIPHYLFFLENQKRWGKSAQIQKRILAPVPQDHDAGWKAWMQFKSAQAEITTVYFIEKLLKKRVHDLEISRPGYKKSCDILASFDKKNVYLEVKAQSGQQHGSQHPCSKEVSHFTPQGEDDLQSWLFEHRISQSTGKAMIPYCLQASEKGADVLVAMIDIMQFETNNFHELGRTLVPDRLSESSESIPGTSLNHGLTISSFTAGARTTRAMGTLREVWLFNSSNLERLLVIRAHGAPKILSR